MIEFKKWLFVESKHDLNYYMNNIENLANKLIQFEDDEDTVIHSKNEAIKRMKDMFSDISNNIHNGEMVIYRKMAVREDWLDWIQTKGENTRVGIYWSYNKGSVGTYGSSSNPKDSDIDIILTAKVNIKHINWDHIIGLMVEVNSLYVKEKEITLYKNTPLNIISIEQNGEIICDDCENIVVKS